MMQQMVISLGAHVTANTLNNVTEKEELVFTLAARDLNSTINLDNVSVGVFLTAMENVAALRASKRCDDVEAGVQSIYPGSEATAIALGRIKDVDMGAESTRWRSLVS